MAVVSVRIDPALVRRAMTGNKAGLVREVKRITDKVEQGARRRVGYSAPDPLGRPRRYPHIRDTIRSEVTIVNGLPTGRVIADHPIARIHHDGSRPHIIRPSAGGRLAFVPSGGTRVVYARLVRHPGTPANRFLTDSLADVRL